MRRHILSLSLFLFALSVPVAPAQKLQGQLFTKGRFSIEPRIGFVFPTGDFGNVDPNCRPGATGCDYPLQIGVEAGWRWEARVHYQLRQSLSAVVGFGKAKLGCSTTFCGFGPEPETQSFSLGLRNRIFSFGSMDFWGEAGGTLEKFAIIRTRDLVGEPASIRVWYPWSPGFFAGGGTELALTGERNFFFTPGFQFRYVSSDPPANHADLDPVTATCFLAELGFKVLLGRN